MILKLLRLTFVVWLCCIFQAQAQLTTGDIAFVAINADGNDDLAFVTFKDIPANTTIYFNDNEWNGLAIGSGGAFTTGEGTATWSSGASIISAGTVITLNDLSATKTASIGTIINSMALGANDEAVFCFLGTDASTPTTFLAAIGKNAGNNPFGDLAGTGLTSGSTAILFANDEDIAEYVGSRTGLTINDYVTNLNNTSNTSFWLTQDASGDQHLDGTAPDVPFNTTVFSFSTSDNTPPSVSNLTIESATIIKVTYNEEVTNATATNTANYVFNPALAISSITYDNATKTATITHAGFADGVAYTLTINGITDLASNTMTTAYVNNSLIFNGTNPDLIITEIMYNPPVYNAGTPTLEFIEIYNNGTTTAKLGGLRIKDGGDFNFVLPARDVAPQTTVLLATDATEATAFYSDLGFIDLPVTGNVISNGGELIELSNSAGTIIDAVTYDDAAPWPTTPDGTGPSLELLNPTLSSNDGTNWKASTNNLGSTGTAGITVFATPGTFTPTITPNISFKLTHSNVKENVATINIEVSINTVSTQESKVDVAVVAGGTAVATTDYTFASQTLTFPANTTASQNATVTIVNNTTAQNARFLVLQISNPLNANLGTTTQHILYILDDDKAAPTATKAIDLTLASSFLVDAAGSAEISDYDPTTKKLFVINSVANKLEILDLTNPAAITKSTPIDMSAYGIGCQSVAVKNGFVAVAVDVANYANGKVIFFNTAGTFIKEVTVGNLPDMVTFSPDGKMVLTANEGQPNADYSIDPEGTISIIDITGGIANLTQTNVTTLNFNAFDSQLATLKAAGVRIYGVNATVSKDMEPEYIAVSDDSKRAYVTLQENNALAFVNLETKTITDIKPLGLKDHNLPNNSLDASDQSGAIIMANWKVKGMYQPDAIDFFEVGGTNYLITANEGDSRDYDALSEEVRVNSSSYVLDPTVFPDATILKRNQNLGRLTVTNKTGDTDGDGDFDEIHVLGGRSFSIWNAATGALVYDSGDLIERIVAENPIYGALFNASNANNNLKNRSDNKGPEPEGVTVVKTGLNKHYAFVGLERIGGAMVFDVTNPAAPIFVDYVNNRLTGTTAGGDLGTEGVLVIPETESPTGVSLLVLANEVSATISVYSMNNLLTPIEEELISEKLEVYPNPSNQFKVYFNKPISFELSDIQGKSLKKLINSSSMDLSDLKNGVYILKTTKGEVKRIVVQH